MSTISLEPTQAHGNAVLYGEIVCVDETGCPVFRDLLFRPAAAHFVQLSRGAECVPIQVARASLFIFGATMRSIHLDPFVRGRDIIK
jgi:hypothetical protein